MTIRASIPLFFRGLPTAATAHAWDELDCRSFSTRCMRRPARRSLRQNLETLSAALRGSNLALLEKMVEPQLVEVSDAGMDRALKMVNLLMKDRCPSN